MARFTHRIATLDDLVALRSLMRRAIDSLQSGFLTPEQVRASHAVMGLDTQLLKDGTYFVVLDGATIAGCGGWSFRATLYGGDASIVARDPVILDPAVDGARIRAMYTNPDYVRQGVGRSVLTLCEDAAAAQGFRRAEMMATLAGEPLYHRCGYRRLDPEVGVAVDGAVVPLVRMGKALLAPESSPGRLSAQPQPTNRDALASQPEA